MLNNGEQYNNGHDFFRDLLETYGKMDAVRIANDYLDTQAVVYGSSTRFYNEDPDEYMFCRELYNAIQTA